MSKNIETIYDKLKNDGIDSNSPFYKCIMSLITVQEVLESLEDKGDPKLMQKIHELMEMLNESFQYRSEMCRSIYKTLSEKIQNIYTFNVIKKDDILKYELAELHAFSNEKRIELLEKKKPFVMEILEKDRESRKILNIYKQQSRIYAMYNFGIENKAKNRVTQSSGALKEPIQRSIKKRYYNFKTEGIINKLKEKRKGRKFLTIVIVGFMAIAGIETLFKNGKDLNSINYPTFPTVPMAQTTVQPTIQSTIPTIIQPTIQPTIQQTIQPSKTPIPRPTKDDKYKNSKFSPIVTEMSDEKVEWFIQTLGKNYYHKPEADDSREFIDNFLNSWFNIKNLSSDNTFCIVDKAKLYTIIDMKFEIAKALEKTGKYNKINPEDIEISLSNNNYTITLLGETIYSGNYKKNSNFTDGLYGLYKIEEKWEKEYGRYAPAAIGSDQILYAVENCMKYIYHSTFEELSFSPKHGFEFEYDIEVRKMFEPEI